jgi:hypothetical protein
VCTAAADDKPQEIELTKAYSIQSVTEGGFYKEYNYSGLAKAKTMRLTLSMTKQEPSPDWVPGGRLFFDENQQVIDDDDPKVAKPLIHFAGKGAMPISLAVMLDNKIRDAQTYKRTLALNQKVNFEVSWATAGKLSVTVDGQEKREIAVPRKIDFLQIVLNSGTYKVEEMIFRN